MDKFKEVAWRLMLAYGAAMRLAEDGYRRGYVNFYGNTLNGDQELTLKAIEDIHAHGIDWDKTSVPEDTMDLVFAGTFAEHDEHLFYLKGDLVLNNNNIYYWAVKIEPNVGFGGLIRSIIQFEDLTLDSALEKLEERVTSPHFPYNTEVPSFA